MYLAIAVTSVIQIPVVTFYMQVFYESQVHNYLDNHLSESIHTWAIGTFGKGGGGGGGGQY